MGGDIQCVCSDVVLRGDERERAEVVLLYAAGSPRSKEQFPKVFAMSQRMTKFLGSRSLRFGKGDCLLGIATR